MLSPPAELGGAPIPIKGAADSGPRRLICKKADPMAFGDLTTLADVKAWLQTGQSAFPTTDDALLTRLITAASQFIQTWLNRQIASQDWIEIRDGVGNALGPRDVRYQFAAFPVTAVSRVVVDGITIPPIST